MPFAQYKNFKECIEKNSDKKDPSAYCATIMHKVEGETMKINYGVAIEKYDIEENPSTKQKSLLVHGIAVQEVTSRNGIKYIAKEIEKAAPTLIGKPILKDHKNDVDHIIGKVIHSEYNKENKSIPFKGLIVDEKMQSLITNGLINHVSIGASVQNMRQEEADNGEKYMVAEGIEILELSVTPVPGVPQASISAGENLFAYAMETLAEQMMKCPECGKMIKDKEEMEKHKNSAHKKEETEVKNMEQQISPELTRAKEALIDIVLTMDNSWTREDLMKCDLESLRVLLAKIRAVETKKAVPKGMVSTTEEVPKQADVIRVPLNADEAIKNVKAGTMVVEQGKNGKINFWKMPDYAKYRKY